MLSRLLYVLRETGASLRRNVTLTAAALLTVVVSLLLWPVGAAYGVGWIYTAAAVGLGGWFVAEAHRLLGRIRRDEDTRPMQLFHISISYLALLSVAIIVDVLV